MPYSSDIAINTSFPDDRASDPRSKRRFQLGERTQSVCGRAGFFAGNRSGRYGNASSVHDNAGGSNRNASSVHDNAGATNRNASSSHDNGGAANRKGGPATRRYFQSARQNDDNGFGAAGPSGVQAQTVKLDDNATNTESSEELPNKRPHVEFHDFLNDDDATIIDDKFDWLAPHTAVIPLARTSE